MKKFPAESTGKTDKNTNKYANVLLIEIYLPFIVPLRKYRRIKISLENCQKKAEKSQLFSGKGVLS